MAQILRHPGIALIGGGWSFFIAENLVLSHNREAIIDACGKQTYLRVYGGLSTCACLSIGYGFLRHGRAKGPRVWRGAGPPGLRAGAVGLQALGLIGLSQMVPKLQLPVTMSGDTSANRSTSEQQGSPGTVQGQGFKVQCPIDFKAADIPDDAVYGVRRVTRHAQLWSLGFLGLGTALATPFATEVLMFSMPAVFAVVGGAHIDYRHRRQSGGDLPPEIDAISSGPVPFTALLMGKQSWGDLANELKWT